MRFSAIDVEENALRFALIFVVVDYALLRFCIFLLAAQVVRFVFLLERYVIVRVVVHACTFRYLLIFVVLNSGGILFHQ